jgi:hypothetical protein
MRKSDPPLHDALVDLFDSDKHFAEQALWALMHLFYSFGNLRGISDEYNSERYLKLIDMDDPYSFMPQMTNSAIAENWIDQHLNGSGWLSQKERSQLLIRMVREAMKTARARYPGHPFF